MRTLIFCLFLILLAGAAWSAVWFYAAHEAGTQLDAWMKAEDDQGRAWTCPDRAIGGYPLAITVSCTKPTFTGKALDQTVQGTVAGLVAEAAVTHPHSLAVALRSPLSYKTSDGAADVTATWSSLAIDLESPVAVRTVLFRGTDLVVDGSFGETGQQGGNAARLDASFAVVPRDSTPALDFMVAVRGSTIPPLDDLLGGKTPVDIDLSGRLDHADVGQARTPEEAIEAWRQAGGRVDLASSRLSRADSSVTGRGTLMLDDAHRPQGRLEASFVGLEPVLKRYGISGNLAAAGSLLNRLFGGGAPPATPSAPGTLNLPISVKNGRLGIGPIRTAIEVPPLY